MFQSKKTNNTISSILGPEIKIEGNIDAKGDLLIYGEVKGNVSSQGTINSSKGSLVQGNISAQNASIHGKITGDLTIKNKAILGKNSHLEGNLEAAIIIIEEGAKFDGMCSMVNQKLNNATAINRSLKTANEQV